MTSKRSDALARPALPYAYAVIPSNRRCPPTIRGKRDVGDFALVACQSGDGFGGREGGPEEEGEPEMSSSVGRCGGGRCMAFVRVLCMGR